MEARTAEKWAREEFGTTPLGDVRRTNRLVAMARGAMRHPSGRVSSVFNRPADREGAYDFLESKHVDVESVARSVFDATARRAEGERWVYVAVDGSQLTLTDTSGSKGFGPVGSPNVPVRGLMSTNALAVSRDGVPLGLIDQLYWMRREPEPGLTKQENVRRSLKRAFAEKETANLLRAAQHAHERLESRGCHAWAVIDREGDNRDILLGLQKLGCLFTVRATWDRTLFGEDSNIHQALDDEPSLGTHDVAIPRRGNRAARTARLEVRAKQVTLRFVKRDGLPLQALRLYAVRVREVCVPPGVEGLEWLLLTNVPVLSAEHARDVVESYRARWRVEEFHRTWKEGVCNVEDAQLRSAKAFQLWATVLAAIATRIERLKYFSRSKPDEPASTELAAEEIEALTLDQRSRKKQKRRSTNAMPSIKVATEWLAELGGWIGAGNGPPGSIVLARGLERLAYLVEGIALARQPPNKRRPPT
jgi:Transposase DNA-binding/Transposase DDE domain